VVVAAVAGTPLAAVAGIPLAAVAGIPLAAVAGIPSAEATLPVVTWAAAAGTSPGRVTLEAAATLPWDITVGPLQGVAQAMLEDTRVMSATMVIRPAGTAVGVAAHGTAVGVGGGWGGWRGGAWRGGYWNGGFWPRCYYGVGFAWFLPILPLAYATYWYGGVPYYYADDVYYTWNPTYDGYVVTDPPPVADASGSADVAAPAAAPGDAGAQTGPGPGGPIAGQIFMYPKNGQSAEQQASDKAECQQWASEQAGQVAQNGSDYNRAMVACVEGRGYSAR